MPSPGPFLVDSYLQHKTYTNQFVQWLVDSASRVRNVQHLLANQTTSTTGEAIPLENFAVLTDTVAPEPSRQVPSGSFRPLANIIQSARIEVPYDTLKLLEHVIRVRKDYSRFFTAQGKAANEALDGANRDHQHFNQLLEDVYGILQPLCSSQHASHDTSHATHAAHSLLLPNLFEHLALEETVEKQTDTSVPKEKSKKAKKSKKSTLDTKNIQTYVIESSEEDKAFAIYCFLNDCTEVRMSIIETWRQYKNHHVSLNVAATYMNSGIEVSVPGTIQKVSR